jgi:hypothetical protein
LQLSQYQIRWALKESGQKLSEQEFERLFKYFDKNGDGSITVSEFLRGVRGDLPQSRERFLENIFRRLTPNPEITIAELQQVFNLQSDLDYRYGKKT